MHATNPAGPASPHGPHRAQRYPLHLPVRYRCAGERQWHLGLTENVSASGAIIRSHEAAAPHSRVTVAIALPSSDHTPGGWLIGEGTVVRSTDSPVAPDSTFAVIASFALARREDVSDITSN